MLVRASQTRDGVDHVLQRPGPALAAAHVDHIRAVRAGAVEDVVALQRHDALAVTVAEHGALGRHRERPLHQARRDVDAVAVFTWTPFLLQQLQRLWVEQAHAGAVQDLQAGVVQALNLVDPTACGNEGSRRRCSWIVGAWNELLEMSAGCLDETCCVLRDTCCVISPAMPNAHNPPVHASRIHVFTTRPHCRHPQRLLHQHRQDGQAVLARGAVNAAARVGAVLGKTGQPRRELRDRACGQPGTPRPRRRGAGMRRPDPGRWQPG